MKTKTLLKHLASPTLAVLVFVAPSAQADSPHNKDSPGIFLNDEVILDETFEAGQRLVQDLPATSAWYGTSSAGDPVLTQPSEGIVTLDTSVNSHLLTYFTDLDPVSLEVGEKLTVAFGFRIEGATSNALGIRIGVMDSSPGEGDRAAEDGHGTGHSRFADYTGYAGFFNPNGGGDTSMRLRKRAPPNSSLLSVASVWPQLASGGGGDIVINGDTDYSGEIEIARVDGGVILTFRLFGDNIGPEATLSHEDTDDPTHAFDTFGIWVNANAADSLSLTSAHISTGPIDGEPAGPSFAAWQDEHFQDETDPDIIGPEAAPAGDGVVNFIKYAFGLEPFVPATPGDFLETETVNGTLQLSYLERVDAADVTYIPEASINLIDWESGPGSIEEIDVQPVPGGDFNRITVRAVREGGENLGFLRVTLRQE